MRFDDGGPAQAARTRARQRLVGALVLLGVGVVSFPLLFETQPRPLAPDIPIAAPRDAAAPPARTASRPVAPLPVLPAEAAAEPPTAMASGTVGTVPAAAVAPVPPTAQAMPAAPAPTAQTPPAEPAAPPKPAPVAAAAAPAPAAAASKPPAVAAQAATGRFVVQVGAYAEERALREARLKAEKLGLKTYIQVIDAEGAKRTRVRVGPFDTREQAEATARKLKSGGLPAAILAL